jgi:flavin-dependent dehydrogenase
LQVLLIERTRFPREKACGDALTPRALQLLDQLGVEVPDCPSVAGVRIRDWNDSDLYWDLDFATPGTVASRTSLDSQLADAAVRSGALLRDGSTVDSILVDGGRVVGVRTRGPRPERLHAPVTILAEGSAGALIRHTPVAQVAGRQTAFAVRRYFENVVWGEELRLELTLPIKSEAIPLAGYAWAFPMQENMANVGIGYFMHERVRGRLTDLLSDFEQILSRDQRFASARAVSQPIGAPIQIGSRSESSVAEGLLVVGDSAGLPNPFWAEGVSRALESGILAGRAAVAHCAHATPLSSYASSLHASAPFFDRLSPSMPSIYRTVCHVAHDLIPLFRTESQLSHAFLTMANAERREASDKDEGSGDSSHLHEVSSRAFRRARYLVSRDRPLFGEVIDQLEAQRESPDRTTPYFYATWCNARGESSASCFPERAAACLEMLRLSAWLLSDVSGPGEVRKDERGGYWLSATLGISLADRIIARLFATLARLDARESMIVSEIATRAFEALTQAALAEEVSVAKLSRIIRSASVTAAARIANAQPQVIESARTFADGMSPSASPDEIASALALHFEEIRR